MDKVKGFNMRASPEFVNLLEKLSAQLGGKPKSQIVEEAVRVFATSSRAELSDKNAVAELVAKLDRLTAENTATKQALDELKTLVLQVLKNQQSP